MIVLFSVVSCQYIPVCELYFSVFGEEAQDVHQCGCASAAVITDVDNDVFDLVMLFDVLKAIVEEGKAAGFLIFFFYRIQIIGRLSF